MSEASHCHHSGQKCRWSEENCGEKLLENNSLQVEDCCAHKTPFSSRVASATASIFTPLDLCSGQSCLFPIVSEGFVPVFPGKHNCPLHPCAQIGAGGGVGVEGGTEAAVQWNVKCCSQRGGLLRNTGSGRGLESSEPCCKITNGKTASKRIWRCVCDECSFAVALCDGLEAGFHKSPWQVWWIAVMNSTVSELIMMRLSR